MEQRIRPAQGLRGTLTVPGDKSISHRALILGALAEGETRLENLGSGRDVGSTLGCLRALGVEISKREAEAIVRGCGLDLSPPKGVLDAGNSGTTMRLLCGVLAGQDFSATITGDESLRRRPMARIIQPLTRMGARIEHQGGRAPLVIRGGNLQGITYEMPVASSQLKSCVLLAGLYAAGLTTVIERVKTRDHTERLLAHFGIELARDGPTIALRGGSDLKASQIQIEIPGDLSAAAFFIAAALLVRDSRLVIRDVGVNPTRTCFLEALSGMGARISLQNERDRSGEPRADLMIESSSLKAISVGGEQIPRLIDELPLLALLATQAYGRTVIRDAQELRVKETDRIRAVTLNLKRMGVELKERADGWEIPGPQALKGAQLASFGDHRIAMAFAVAGLVAQGETVIHGAEWADVSFPGFFQALRGLAQP